MRKAHADRSSSVGCVEWGGSACLACWSSGQSRSACPALRRVVRVLRRGWRGSAGSLCCRAKRSVTTLLASWPATESALVSLDRVTRLLCVGSVDSTHAAATGPAGPRAGGTGTRAVACSSTPADWTRPASPPPRLPAAPRPFGASASMQMSPGRHLGDAGCSASGQQQCPAQAVWAGALCPFILHKRARHNQQQRTHKQAAARGAALART